MAKLIHYTDPADGKNKSGKLQAEDSPPHSHTQWDIGINDPSNYTGNLAPGNGNAMNYLGKALVRIDELNINPPHNHNASQISVSTTNFNKNLTSTDDTVQKALDKLDDMSAGSALPAGANNSTLRHNGTAWEECKYVIKYRNNNYSRLQVLSPVYSAYNPMAEILTNSWDGNAAASVGIRAGASGVTMSAHRYDASVVIEGGVNSYIGIRSSGYNYVNPIMVDSNNNSVFSVRPDGRIFSKPLEDKTTFTPSILMADSNGEICRSNAAPTTITRLQTTGVAGGVNNPGIFLLFPWGNFSLYGQFSFLNFAEKVVSILLLKQEGFNWIDNTRGVSIAAMSNGLTVTDSSGYAPGSQHTYKLIVSWCP